MRTSEMVKDDFFRAKWCLKEAEMTLSEENYPMCVRRSQEALELVTKALLRSMAIEYPREYNEGMLLLSLQLPRRSNIGRNPFIAAPIIL